MYIGVQVIEVNTVTYAVEVMQYGGTSSVSDVWHVDPLVVEVFNGHLLFKLSW